MPSRRPRTPRNTSMGVSKHTSNIQIRQWVFPQGNWKLPTDEPVPLEVAGPLTHKAVSGLCEGAIDMYVDGVGVITRDLTWWGYLFDWWREALDAVESLLVLRSVVWNLPGKTLHVAIEIVAGTRRARVQLRARHNPEHGPAVEVHVAALVDALLDGAEQYIRWCGPYDTSTLERVEQLRRAPAPWRYRPR